jgi:murein DD-endopeptidase MepM/ murein hydrolase activator NlpD
MAMTPIPGLDALPQTDGCAAPAAASTSVSSTSASGSATGATPARPNAEQLRALAAQFESLLMNQMLQTMRSSVLGNDDDEQDDAGFAKGPLADAMYSELSVALSRAGGIGIGDAIMGPLLQQAGGAGLPSLSGELSVPLSVAVPSVGGGSSATVMPAAMPDLAAIGRSALSKTLESARVSSRFGWRQDPIDGDLRFHKGTDIAMPVGQDVPAAQAGRVSFVGERPGYGVTVEVDHGAGLTTRYAHLSEIDVQVGDPVAAGQTLGKSGATGRVTGPNLHFEILDQGQAIDPSSGLARLSAAAPGF